jgi:hypothetical protein
VLSGGKLARSRARVKDLEIKDREGSQGRAMMLLVWLLALFLVLWAGSPINKVEIRDMEIRAVEAGSRGKAMM